MVNKCRVLGCTTNYQGHESAAVFKLPKNEEVKQRWIKFLNRKDVHELKNVFVCEKHFEEKYLKRNDDRVRLINSLFPVPTLCTGTNEQSYSVLPSNLALRKPPAERVFQQDELKKFKDYDSIYSFSDIDESLLKVIQNDFQFSKFDDHAVFYKIEWNDLSVPNVTYCIRVDCDLHVKLFYKGSSLPLPAWFRKNGRHNKLTSKSMFQNLLPYIKGEVEKHGRIFEELHEIRYQKQPVYSASLIRYALTLRYTSLPTYKLLLEEFKLPSLSFLSKLTRGSIDAVEAAKVMRENKIISDDVILIFDEIYLQKCEEYFGGDTYGINENGDLHKGMVCFMIVGLQSNVPYVLKTVPETEIKGEWLKGEIENCIEILQGIGFNVRAVVCDNHQSNVSAYKNLLRTYGNSENDLSMNYNGQKVYLFFDSVHLVKNLRNNLLNRKRFIFPPFQFDGFYDPVIVPGGEISWNLLHQVFEQDKKMQANLKTATKISAKVLHPGNCKQSVSVALAIFDQSTSASIKYYFPERKDAAEFLHLFNVWWSISNSKERFNSSYRLGNAVVPGDNKPQFLRSLADWIETWESEKIRNAERFTLTAQTSYALRRTLRCHAALIEDLLQDGYKYVLTARFQSDPLERRYGQYRQMSGGRFLISAKDVNNSEKILKIKSLVREGFDIEDSIKIKTDYTEEEEDLVSSLTSVLGNEGNRVSLEDNSKEVADNIAGYIAYRAQKYSKGCCYDQLIDEDTSNGNNYHKVLSRGGLKVPTKAFSECVAHGFAILDASSTAIQKSAMPSRYAAQSVLRQYLCSEVIQCEEHKEKLFTHVIRVITNIFFNNKRKRTADAEVKDGVAKFKRKKRDKNC